jgi:superfamily II DNA or RNA helicase
LTKQWQEDELGIKFNMPFKLVNRSIFASDPNVFHSTDKIVTSIDFISREDVLNVAGNSNWDLIVFDEAHKLSAYEYGSKIYRSQRYEAAYKLLSRCNRKRLTPRKRRNRKWKQKHAASATQNSGSVVESGKCRKNDWSENQPS